MNTEYVLGVIFGIAAGVLLFFLLRKKTPIGRCEADERQLLARGRASQTGFYIFMIEMALGMVLSEEQLPVTPGALFMIFLIIPVLVYAVICVFKDAYMGIHGNLRGFCILGSVMIAVETGYTAMIVSDGRLIENGQLTWWCIVPGVALLWAVVLGALFIRSRQLRSEEEE